MAKEYEKLGRDEPPPGNTFSARERRSQDTLVNEIKKLPVCRGRIGHDVTVAELKRAIRKLKYGKASGEDFISTDLLKILGEDEDSEVALAALAMLFTQCLEAGRVPADWGTAIVTALYKKGDKSDWANYQLISLLSVVGKCFEAVLAARLSAYLDESGGLSEFQCGFRKGRRCQHHSFVLAEAVKSNARARKKTYAAFLAVRKADPPRRRSAMLGRL